MSAYNASVDVQVLQNNLTLLLVQLKRLQSDEKALQKKEEDEYHQLMKDLWIGCILSIIIISFVLCSCSFIIYHKFQKWKIACKCVIIFLNMLTSC